MFNITERVVDSVTKPATKFLRHSNCRYSTVDTEKLFTMVNRCWLRSLYQVQTSPTKVKTILNFGSYWNYLINMESYLKAG